MKVSNKLYPSDEQMQGFFDGDVDTPISMVNLLKFKKVYFHPFHLFVQLSSN